MRNNGRRKFAGGWSPGKEGAGPSGQCVCMKCGFRAPKKKGTPCMEEKCPKCGSVLLREGGSHYQKAAEKI